MWTRNIDTGKWFLQTDTLSKESYDSLKQDLEKVRLYSKCLSGATYLPINSFNDIYDPLAIDRIGYYVAFPNSANNQPLYGPDIAINFATENEFYKKYLHEYGFTLKNLFTPDKLIDDQLNNFFEVDVATTERLANIGQTVINLTIDGVSLIEGHRVLVKDQYSEINLLSTVDPEDYFLNVELVATYSIIEDNITNILYQWPNTENGIYIYTNNQLVRVSDLDEYIDAYRYSVNVKLGQINREKQYHLMRLKNGFFPLTSENQNIYFAEKNNWVLRNRVDYNNIFDINYNDIIFHEDEIFFNQVESYTYSIPARTIAVGEFGTIISNQDKINQGSTFSLSNIVLNKYKVILNSISHIQGYYWVCGNEGTLLKISKVDFSIEKILLDETSDLTSVSFFGDLNGIVVGKYNTIYWTNDGGLSWNKYSNPSLEGFSYLTVYHYNLFKAYIGGESGVFLELEYTNNNWQSYKRKIAKQLTIDDEYLLYDDINDLAPGSLSIILNSSYVENPNSLDFHESLDVTNSSGSIYGQLRIDLDSRYFGGITFSNSGVLVGIKISDFYTNTTVYQSQFWNAPTFYPFAFASYNFYQYTGSTKYSATFSLPTGPNGDLLISKYLIQFDVWYNYVGSTDTNLTNPVRGSFSYTIETINTNYLLIACNTANIICYDYENRLANTSNPFIYLTSTQSLGDIKTISQRPLNNQIYFGENSSIYRLDAFDIVNNLISQNTATVSLTKIADYYVNEIFLTSDNFYIAGNFSLLRIGTYSTNFDELDPTFYDDLRSRMLFLDYDMASKLNFFTDFGQYRLASTVTFSTVSLTQSNAYLNVSNIPGEYNWLNYYKDAEKTFTYYSSISDQNRVEFSTTFSKVSSTTGFTFSGSGISLNPADILPIAPNILSPTQSIFIEDPSNPIANLFSCAFDVLLQKQLIIFKRRAVPGSSYDVKIGDVLRLESSVIDCNLVVNRIERYQRNIGLPNAPGVRITNWPINVSSASFIETYIYCYSNFNDNIMRNLKKLTSTITVTNLNRYTTAANLVTNFEKHPISIGYKLVDTNLTMTLSQRFNNKTAYYNMQSRANGAGVIKDMVYENSFLSFGYSPQYNILDYLSRIDSNIFDANTVFSVMPEYYNLPGNNGQTFNANNIYIDLSEGQQTGTFSWYRNGTNQIIFGEDYRSQWESLLKYTFIDLTLYSNTFGPQTNYRLLIVDKYYDSSVGGYVMVFDKKIEVTNANTFNVISFDILSRNTLGEISADLQLLNNIQRTTTTRSVQYLNTFTNFENPINSKFYTDAYCRILCSDFNIRKNLSAIVYVDDEFQVAMNVLNLEKEIIYDTTGTSQQVINGFTNKLGLGLNTPHDLLVGDYVYIEFTGGTGSSQELNPEYTGYQTIIFSSPFLIITSKEFGVPALTQDVGKIRFVKRDPFFNYQPIDLFDLGVDKEVTRAIEILPEMTQLVGSKQNLVNVDLTKFRFELMDGLSLMSVNRLYHWILEAEISGALIGLDPNGIVWYSGTWHCGRWFGGTWYSGTWVSGDWYAGTWSSVKTQYQVINVQVDTAFVDFNLSKWYNGRWFDGTWNGGTWYNGRRYSGSWNDGIWYNGIWNDGTWESGLFSGGVWVLGKWGTGIFNCDSKPAYWLDGQFISGDFENGIWYNGQFGNRNNLLARFGTKAENSKTATWHAGKWLSGEFHSQLNIDPDTGLPTVSNIHKYSIWRTGIWLQGDFWGGIAYNISFRGGVWHGGILEEIQVIGVSQLIPATTSENSITLNGIFKFNVGDEVWIIDDERDGAFSPIGNNDNPSKYRINFVEENESTAQTKIFLNYNLSSLNLNAVIAGQTFSNAETGLRVVSYFKDVTWESGLWTNGIFEGGQFDSGIWYNGIFNGNWGN